MAANEYIPGQVVVLTDVINDPSNNNAPIDDNTDVVTVYKPDGLGGLILLTPTPVVTHSGAAGSGIYKAQVTLDVPGWWEYRWASTGAASGAGRNRFYVSPWP